MFPWVLLLITCVMVFVGVLLRNHETFEEVTLLTSNQLSRMGGGAQLYNRPCVVPLSFEDVKDYQTTHAPIPTNLSAKAKFPTAWKQFYSSSSGFGTNSCMLPKDDFDVLAGAAGCSEANTNIYNPEIVQKIFPFTDEQQNRCVIHFKPGVADDQMHAYISSLKSVRDGRERALNNHVYMTKISSSYYNNRIYPIQNYAALFERPHTETNMMFTGWVRITQRDGQRWSHVFGTSDKAPAMRCPTLWIHPDKPQLQLTLSRTNRGQFVHNAPDLAQEDPRKFWRNWMFLATAVRASPTGQHTITTTVRTYDVTGNQVNHYTVTNETDDLALSNQKRRANNINNDVERAFIFNRREWWNNGRGFQVHDMRVSDTLLSNQEMDTTIRSGLADLSMATEAANGVVMPVPYIIQTMPSAEYINGISLTNFAYTDWWQNYDLMRDILEGLLVPNPLFNPALPENATDNIKFFVKRVKFIAYLGVLYEIKRVTPAAWSTDVPTNNKAVIELVNKSDPAAGLPPALTQGKEIKNILGFVECPSLPLYVPESLNIVDV